MALDVWFKSDIQNALSAAEQASGAVLRAANEGNDPYVAGYEAGYRAALATVALAFGLVPTSLRPTSQRDRPIEPFGYPFDVTQGKARDGHSRRSLAAPQMEAETAWEEA